MSNNMGDSVHTRLGFYRDNWRIMVVSLPVFAIAFLVMALAVAYALTREPEPRYFAVDNGRLTPMAPLSVPYVSEANLVAWVSEAVTSAYILDFQHWRDQIQSNGQYFTKTGFEDYQDALMKSGRLKMIQENWFVTNAVPEAPPVILQKGIVGGRHLWKIRMPIVLSFTSKTQRINPQRIMLTITVARVNTWENPYGIGISQIVERAI